MTRLRLWLTQASLPVRGAWIEMFSEKPEGLKALSLPVRGAWIEMVGKCPDGAQNQSLPVRGAWIEITRVILFTILVSVAPRAGSVD